MLACMRRHTQQQQQQQPLAMQMPHGIVLALQRLRQRQRQRTATRARAHDCTPVMVTEAWGSVRSTAAAAVSPGVVHGSLT
jgi:hypothetical protein